MRQSPSSRWYPHPPQALAYVGHSVAERAPKSNTNHRMGCTDLLGLFRFLSVHSIPVSPADQSGRRTATPPGPLAARHAAGSVGGRHEPAVTADLGGLRQPHAPAVAATWADGRQRDHLVSRKTVL